ncbi:Derlin [Moelleriella libera RCEF 2490]|uniref:Derlin n=1 Tax=Moelleriella libera RCEF 2490 TaxID=1081109 RepID=A0A168CDX5_9HYPO|nr:Derlin [Moelleriella libera RCEF 2490]
MDVATENYMRLPPLSRTVATFTFAVSAGIVLGILPAQYFIFHTFYLWRFPPQIWRLVTSFFVTSPGLGLLFDTYFLYSYLSQMEVGNPRFPRKEDLIWYLTFVCGTILVANHITGFGFMSFLPALILAMAYTVTQEQRGAKVNYMFITMPAQLMPFAMLAINLLFPGGAMNLLLQLHGLFAGHLFDFLTKTWPNYGGGRNLIPTPVVMSRLVQSVESFISARTAGGSRPAGQRLGGGSTSGSGSGASTSSGGPLPDSWRTRGPGQRLG